MKPVTLIQAIFLVLLAAGCQDVPEPLPTSFVRYEIVTNAHFNNLEAVILAEYRK